MRKFLTIFVILFALAFWPSSAQAACSGSSPSWTAASPAATDVLACMPSTVTYNGSSGGNASFVSGDTVTMPAGSASWTHSFHITGTSVTLTGSTVCSGAACAPGSGGVGLNTAFQDNSGTCSNIGTCITTSVDQAILLSTSAANFVRLTGFALIISTSDSHYTISYSGGTYAQVGFRIDHLHIVVGITQCKPIWMGVAVGLIDHIFMDDPLGCYAMVNINGHDSDGGYTDWTNSAGVGTNNAVVVEDFYDSAPTSHLIAQGGLMDGANGGRAIIRYGIIAGCTSGLGGPHGYDSGQRSFVLLDAYHLTFSNTCDASLSLGNDRGGIYLLHDNTFGGAHSYTALDLDYYRYEHPDSSKIGNWGIAAPCLNWEQIAGSQTQPNTLIASAWAGTHSYSACSGVTDSNGCNLYSVAGGTSSSSLPTCPAVNATVTDGTVTWINAGGSTSAGVGVPGWLPANPDMAGSTAGYTYYVDGPTPGGLPCGYRDQPGCGPQGQTLFADWAWNNTGAQVPSPIFTSTAAAIVVSGTNYFPNTALSGYVAYTYPDPLNTGGSASTGSSISGGTCTGCVIHLN